MTQFLCDAGCWRLEVPFSDSEWGCEYDNYRMAIVVNVETRGQARSEMIAWLRDITAFPDIEWTEPMSIRKLPSGDNDVRRLVQDIENGLTCHWLC